MSGNPNGSGNRLCGAVVRGDHLMISGRRAFTFITNRPAAPTRAELSQHAIQNVADQLGLPPVAVRLRQGKSASLFVVLRHVDEHGRGAFHVAGKQEPREGNRVAF